MSKSARLLRLLVGSVALVTVLAANSQVDAPKLVQAFTPQQLHEDLDAFQAAIARTHPNVNHSVDAAQLARAFADVRAKLNRNMTRDETWVVMSALNPVLADAHLVLTFPGGRDEVNRHLKSGGLLFPFNVYVDAHGEIFIKSKANGESTTMQGMRIESIDGVRGSDISARLLAHVNGDTHAFRTALMSERFAILYWKLFGERRAFRLKIAGSEASFDGSDAMPLTMKDNTFEQLFNFELLDTKQAVLTINEFYWQDKAKFYEFTKSAFTRMRDAGTQTLVIDIRSNGGGDDDVWVQGIMPYIATKPYRNGSDYLLKIIDGRQKEGQKVGDVVVSSQTEWYQPTLDNPLRFKGKVYVLIGPRTYSSSVLFANAVQDMGFATIAGIGGAARTTQSGGTQNGKLPHTGLGFVVPRFVLKRSSGAEGFMQPDIYVADDPFRPRTAIETLISKPR